MTLNGFCPEIQDGHCLHKQHCCNILRVLLIIDRYFVLPQVPQVNGFMKKVYF